MNNLTAFNTEDALFQLKIGEGVMIDVADLNEESVGYGIFRDLWRDFEWLYITSVTRLPNGSVEIKYLGTVQIDENSKEDKVVTKITGKRAAKFSSTYLPGTKVLISTAKIDKPRQFKTTTVTTFEELLYDAEPPVDEESLTPKPELNNCWQQH